MSSSTNPTTLSEKDNSRAIKVNNFYDSTVTPLLLRLMLLLCSVVEYGNQYGFGFNQLSTGVSYMINYSRSSVCLPLLACSAASRPRPLKSVYCRAATHRFCLLRLYSQHDIAKMETILFKMRLELIPKQEHTLRLCFVCFAFHH